MKRILKPKSAKIFKAVAIFVVVITLFLSSNLSALAANFNKQINYQGKLTNLRNVAVDDGDYNIEFKLYDGSGTNLWTETRSGANRVTVSNGLFSVLLGAVTPISSLDFNQPLYLGVNIGGTTTVAVWDGEMTPRKQLGAVPSAFEADKVDGLDGSQFVRTDTASAIASSSATTLLTITQTGVGDILNIISNSTPVFQILNSGVASTSDLIVSDTLTVSGLATSTFAGGFTIGGSQFVVEQATGNIGVATSSPFAKLSVAGLMYADYASTTALTVSGDAWFGTTGSSNLTVFGTTTLAISITGPLQAVGGLVTASSTISVAYGGTGNNSFPQGAWLYGNGTGAVGASTSPTVDWLTATAQSATSTFNGNVAVHGNLTLGGNTGSDLVMVNSRIASNLIPEGNTIFDLGSPEYYWRNIYADNLNVNQMTIASTSISGTNNSSFTINADNTTADNEDADLIFFRGTVVPNAVISWEHLTDNFLFNQATKIENHSPTTTIPTLTVNGYDGQTANIIQVASSSGDILFSVGSDGSIHTGDSLYLSGVAYADYFVASSTSHASIFLYASSTALTVSGNSYLGTTTITNLAVTNTSTSTFAGAIGSSSGDLVFNSFGTSNYLLLNPYGGNVGIGTTSPYAMLSVAGQIVGQYFTATSTTIASTFPYASTTALTVSGNAYLGTTTMTNLAVTNTSTSTIAGGLTVKTNALVVDKVTGYVGINTVSPAYTLDVNGTLNAQSISIQGASTASYFTATDPNATSTFAGGLNVGANGSNVLVVNSTNYRVGIGTDSPLKDLHVVGSGDPSSIMIGGAGSIADNQNAELWFAESFLANQDVSNGTRLYHNALDTSSFSIHEYFAGTDVGGIDIKKTTGYVGIGTTSPYAMLSVAGEIVGKNFTATSTAATSTFAGGLTVGTSKLVVDLSTGYMGIGTASPSGLLDVYGSNAGGTVNVYFRNMSANTGSSKTTLNMPVFNGAGGLSIQQNTSSAVPSNMVGNYDAWITTGQSNSYLHFSAGSKNVRQMTLHPDGLLGIGQAITPTSMLYVKGTSTYPLLNVLSSTTASTLYVDTYGNVGIGTTTPSSNLYVFNPSTTSASVGATIENANSSYNANFVLKTGTANTWMLQAGGSLSAINGKLGFYDSIASAYRMVIDSSGWLGVGTTTPNYVFSSYSATAPQLALSAGAGVGQWTFRNAGGDLFIATTTVAGTATTSTSALTIFGSRGDVIIGGSPTQSYPSKLYVLNQYGTNDQVYAARVENVPTSPTNRTIGGYFEGKVINGAVPTGSGNYVAGIEGRAISSSTSATVDTAYGMKFTVENRDNATLTNGTGVTVSVNNYANGGTGTITTAKGIDIGIDKTGGTITNAYGLYINALVATNKFGIYQAGGGDTNYFAGMMGVGTTTPNYALTVASTTAPQLALSAGAGVAQWTVRNNGGNLYFATTTIAGSSVTPTSALTILNSGNYVGIGLNSPTATLHVAGTAKIAVSGTSGTVGLTSYISTGSDGGSEQDGGGGGVVYLAQGGNNGGSVNSDRSGGNGGTVYIAGGGSGDSDGSGGSGGTVTMVKGSTDGSNGNDGTVNIGGGSGNATLNVYGSAQISGLTYLTGGVSGAIDLNGTASMSSANEILFSDNGQIRSYDDNHRIIFDRTNNNILELREFGSIILSAGATTGARTSSVVVSGTAATFAGNIGMSAGKYLTYNGVNLAMASTSKSSFFFGNAGNLTMTGSLNTAVGNSALGIVTSGGNNTAIGGQSLFWNTTGSSNTAVGASSLFWNDSGSYNTAVGDTAGLSNRSGTYNTFIGYGAGQSETLQKQNAVNSMALGYSALTTASNQVVLGSTTITTTLLNGSVGVGTTTPVFALNPYSATAPQLALSSGAGFAQWAFRNAGGNLYFATTTLTSTATTSSSALTILGSNGFVGIGSTVPSTVLEVTGSGVSANNTVVKLNSFYNGTDNVAINSYLLNANGASTIFAGLGFSNTTRTAGSEEGSIKFNTIAGGNWGTAMTLQGGALGLGMTPAPNTQILQVNGDALFYGGVTANNDVCDTNSGYCLSNMSDRRLKTDIQSIGDTLDRVMQLNPVTYKWNDLYLSKNPNLNGATSTKIGFIAQEVQGLFPEAVLATKGEGYLQVDYEKMVPVLTRAIQEQQATIASLSASIASLSARLDSVITNGQVQTSGFWTLDGNSGVIKPLAGLDLNNYDIENVRAIKSASASWSIDADGKLAVKEIEVTDRIKIGNADKRIGMTLFDEQTGEPYCVFVSGGIMKTTAGECGATTATTTPNPVTNPVVIIPNPTDGSSDTTSTTPPTVAGTSTESGDTSTTTSSVVPPVTPPTDSTPTPTTPDPSGATDPIPPSTPPTDPAPVADVPPATTPDPVS